MNMEDLGHKGRLQAFSKCKGSFTRENEDIYRLIFKISALPGQLSVLDRTHA
jgi:hypothetical protein